MIRAQEHPVARLLAPVRGQLGAAVVFQVVASLAGVVPFVAVAELGRLLLAKGGGEPGRAWLLVGVGAAGATVNLAAATAATTLSHLADNTLQLDLRRRLAHRLGQLPLGWFSGTNAGQVKKAMHDDVHGLHYLVAHTALDLTAVIVTPAVALAYLAVTDWRLAVVNLVPLAASIWLFRRAMSGARHQFAAYGRAVAEINASIVEFVDGIAVIKTFGRARSAHERFAAAAVAFSDFFTGWVQRTATVTTASQLAVSPVVVLVLMLGAGAALVTAGSMPAPDLVPFALLSPALVAPAGAVGTRVQAWRTGSAAARSILDLLDEAPLPQPENPQEPEGTAVQLRGVSFSYDGTDDVLADIDLDLAPGTVTALVGRSGAGKSTLAMLVPRFFDVTAGSVSIGGVDVRDLGAARLYTSVGFVFQDVALLRRSVAENIRLGRPAASLDEVVRAARAAQIHDRITEAPLGYDSVPGRDVTFSGGEAQRISIARALLADAPVLVLDEATAFADPHAEAMIQDALSAVAAGRTLLVIAHRLSTITEADQIVVLEAGRIVERGRHEELLVRSGRYATMWRAQDPGGALLSEATSTTQEPQ